MIYKYGTDHNIKCPFCNTEMTALNITQEKTLLRCPNIATPKMIEEDHGIKNWKYSGKCGRLFYLLV